MDQRLLSRKTRQRMKVNSSNRILQAREDAAQSLTSLPNSFACRMMKKMGWKEGQGLGKSEGGIKERIKVNLRKGDEGLGFNTGKDKAVEVSDQWWLAAYDSSSATKNGKEKKKKKKKKKKGRKNEKTEGTGTAPTPGTDAHYAKLFEAAGGA